MHFVAGVDARVDLERTIDAGECGLGLSGGQLCLREITVDYRHLLPPGQAEDFVDSLTGETICGLSWQESLASSTRALAELLGATER